MLSCFSCVWLFVTLRTVAHQAPLPMEFSRQEYWSGLPCPTPGDLSDAGIEPMSPTFSALQVDSLPSKPPRKPFRPDRFGSVQFSRSVASDSATPWTAARQASLSITNSWSFLKFMSIELVMLSNHLILCHLLLLPSLIPSIREWVSSLHQVAKVLKFQLQQHFLQWIFRVDFL